MGHPAAGRKHIGSAKQTFEEYEVHYLSARAAYALFNHIV
jgi:hypothetical protein